MKPQRKPKGGEYPPMTQLKQLPPEKHDLVWSWRGDRVNGVLLTNDQIVERINTHLNIKLTPGSHISRFWRWYEERQDTNKRVEQHEELVRKQNPDWTPEQIRQDGMNHFMKLMKEANDADKFASMARVSQSEDFKKRSASQTDRHLDQEDRKIKLLEQKAEAYTRAQAAISEAKKSKGGITPETIRRIEEELRLL